MSLRSVTCIFLFLAVGFSACEAPDNTFKVQRITCEYLQNPLGIDKPDPILSWQLVSDKNGQRQTTCRILVASSTERLQNDQGDLWDTGKITSGQNLNIKYQGQPLESTRKYYWKVKVWDATGSESAWSEPAFWRMGILQEEEWHAKWISHKYAEVSEKREPFSQYDDSRTFYASDSMAVYTRREFTTADRIVEATAYISGLGYYELYLNGRKVGNRIMDPVFTDYQKRVKYAAYDVTEYLNTGENAVGVILGNGFYNLAERDLFQMEKANWKTPKKLLLKLMLTYEGGETEEILTDADWKWSFGPLVYNSIRGGETIDARINIDGWKAPQFNDEQWRQVMEVPAPVGKMSFQYMPPMREVKSFAPIASWSPRNGVHVFDFGENLTGYADVLMKGRAGQRVTIGFNEVLNTDSTLNVRHSAGHTWGRFQQGEMILSGAEEDRFEPRFTYHGFRYIQISGVSDKTSIGKITAHAVNTDLKTTGSFECSNERLNQLQAATVRTLLNAVHSMPGEEATREKMGWTFDAGMVTMESYLYNFDAVTTYKKYLQDLIDAQEPNGHVPSIVPTNGWGFLEKTKDGRDTTIRFDDPWWGGTIVYVTDELFRATGDTSILQKAYRPVKAYTDFVASTAQDHLVHWSLGDWLDLKHGANGWGPGLTPIVQTSTAASYYFHDRVSKFAGILGNAEDEITYGTRADDIRSVFNRTFLDDEGWYSQNSQTAQALPLFLGMVPEERKEQVLENLIQAVEDNDHHTSVGFIGVKPLLKYLSENGHLNKVYRMVTQERSPGWLHFVKDEKSTLGENLNAEGYGTGHHPFATVIGFWLYEYPGGITIDETSTANIILRPGITSDLEWVNASCHSLNGRIVSNWKRQGTVVEYYVEIPVNNNARLFLPTGDTRVTSEGRELRRVDGSFPLSSGRHRLKIEL